MAVYDIYSRRLKRAQQTEPELYTYDEIPKKLRIQICHLWDTAIGNSTSSQDSIWKAVERVLSRELGHMELGEAYAPASQCKEFLMKASTVNVLDIVEMTFRAISAARSLDPYFEAEQTSDDAIEELNLRFRQHAVGYEFADDQILRIDSRYVHSEAVKPALALLQSPGFKNVEEEFRVAHDHYRAGNFEDAITNAGKCFESLLKTICTKHGWTFDAKDTAAKLLDAVIREGLVPGWMKESLLGLPRFRNKHGGHGKGASGTAPPRHFASHALHLAAVNIVFVVEADKALGT